MSVLPWCTVPWYHLTIRQDHFAPCCYMVFNQLPEIELESPDLLSSLFNSNAMTELRSRLVKHDIKGSPCEHCYGREKDFGVFFRDELRSFPAFQKARNAFRQGEVLLRYPPFHLALGTASECNLRCKMCYTTWDDASGVKQPGVPMPSFFKVLEKNGWDNIAHIGMSGGEPLLTGEFGFALEYFSRHRINTVILEVTTNGILLNQFFDSLERCNLRKMRFTISVDGVGRAYEEIRKGASWERLNENLALLSELVGGRAGWDVEIHSLVMRSTLSHMEDVVSLADEYGFELVFNSITGIENIDENIFAFPSLVDNLPWDDYFDAALGRARECGFHRACQNLEDCRVLLGRRVRGVSNAMHRADWNVLSRWDRYVSKEIGTRPCVIAGFSEQSFGFLELNQKFDIRGVADFKPTPKVLGRFGGVSVYPLEKLGNLARDIVLDTQTYNQNHRVDLIRKMYPHHQVHLIDLFDQNTYETINTLVSLLADRSIVLFGAGGTGRLLYSQTKLGQLNVKAFADNNKQKQTRGCCGLPVIPAEAIFDIAKDVIILSPRFFNQISQQLNGLFGDKIRVYNLF